MWCPRLLLRYVEHNTPPLPIGLVTSFVKQLNFANYQKDQKPIGSAVMEGLDSFCCFTFATTSTFPLYSTAKLSDTCSWLFCLSHCKMYCIVSKLKFYNFLS